MEGEERLGGGGGRGVSVEQETEFNITLELAKCSNYILSS